MRLILGGPGTGKTSRLLDLVEAEIAKGVDPARIAFVSFTSKAASEAAERAIERFGLSRADLPYFRTLHSIAYRAANIERSEVMQSADYRRLGGLLGVEFSSHASASDGPMITGADGDKMQQILSYARATCTSLSAAWHHCGEGVDWHTLKYYVQSLKLYKSDTCKIDFDDMLDRFVAHCEPLDVDVVFIDEAQDLSTKHWEVARHAFKNAARLYIAGDDDQAIYRWSGADVEQFLELTTAPEVLPVSHRLPVEVFNLAERVAGRIAHRYTKHWRPAGHSGHVVRTTLDDDFELGEGTWMLLARNSVFLTKFRYMVRQLGYAYRTNTTTSVDHDECRAILIWEALLKGKCASAEDVRHMNQYLGHNRMRDVPRDDEREYIMDDLVQDYGLRAHTHWYDALLTIGDEQRQYYQAILRNGEKLTATPRIYVGTIHSVKGGEADNVVLSTNITYRTSVGYQMQPDDEHRVFYTGITRTRKNLFLLDATSREYYDFQE